MVYPPTDPGTDRVWRSATTLIEANALPLSQTANQLGFNWRSAETVDPTSFANYKFLRRCSQTYHTNTDGPPLAAYPRENPVQTLCPGVQVQAQPATCVSLWAVTTGRAVGVTTHDSASGLPARQHSTCQRPEGRRSVTDLSLHAAGTMAWNSLPPSRPLSLRRPLCHHSVDIWNLICSQSRFRHDDNFG